jgi:NADPH-dependent ferric siderophore reductase
MTQAPTRPAGRTRTPFRLEVVATERIAPSMQRIVAGGAGFARFAEKDRLETDKYVKLLVFPAGVTPPADGFSMEELSEQLEPDEMPTVRTYTVRWVDHEAEQLAIDFVVHGDEGVAGPWAARAQVGDPITFMGPGAGYRPSRDVDWHLLAGDEAAIPAIAASLADLPADARAHVFVEVDTAADELPLSTAADVTLTWLHREGRPAGSTSLIADAVTAMAWPSGTGHAFVHGEAGLMRALRSFLLTERGMARELVSISGYWRRGDTEEGFREWKRVQPAD